MIIVKFDSLDYSFSEIDLEENVKRKFKSLSIILAFKFKLNMLYYCLKQVEFRLNESGDIMAKFKDQQEFEKYRANQINEREKYLTDEEKEKRNRLREINRKASKKIMESTDIVRIKLKAISEEDKKRGSLSEKDRWKESAKFLGISMNKMVEKAVAEYIENHHDKIETNKSNYEFLEKLIDERWKEKRSQFYFEIVSSGQAAKDLDKAVSHKVHWFVEETYYLVVQTKKKEFEALNSVSLFEDNLLFEDKDKKKREKEFEIPRKLLGEKEKELEDELKDVIRQSRQYYK